MFIRLDRLRLIFTVNILYVEDDFFKETSTDIWGLQDTREQS